MQKGIMRREAPRPPSARVLCALDGCRSGAICYEARCDAAPQKTKRKANCMKRGVVSVFV